MLKGLQNLVCVNRRSGVITLEMRLSQRARFLLLACRRCRGAIWNFFVNSGYHVGCLVWANIMRVQTLMWGFSICILGCLQKRVRSELELIGSKKSSSLDTAQNATLGPTELLGQFLCHSIFHFL